MVPSQNPIRCFDDIRHDKNAKFERPRKMRQAIRSEHNDFVK